MLARGYRAMKVVIIPLHPRQRADCRSVGRTARMMGALRGRGRARTSRSWSTSMAAHASVSRGVLPISTRSSPRRPMFVEEVLPPGDQRRAARGRVARPAFAIAAGERLIDLGEFEDLFRHRSISIAQPDICHCGACGRPRKSPPWPKPQASAWLRTIRSARSPGSPRCISPIRPLKPRDPGGNGRGRSLVL